MSETEPLTGRSVLVTGHTGFKGSWLALWLHRLGAKVSGLALDPPTTPSHFVAAAIEPVLARHVVGDVRDYSLVSRTIDEVAPEVVFHLAAQPLVRLSYASPLDTFDVNVRGTTNVLEAVRVRQQPCAVVVVTSDKCYANDGRSAPYREDAPLGGADPYSASKGAAELVVAAYRRSFFQPERIASHGIRVASARAGNVIGGGDWARDRIVVDAVRALSAGQPVPVRNPESVRPWQHVLEPLHGYLLLARALLSGDAARHATAYNFGPRERDHVTVQALVEQLCRSWGGDARWIDLRDPEAPHEAAILRLAIDKAQRELVFEPRWALAHAIERTARWFHAFQKSPGAMREVSLGDIDDYISSTAARDTLR